MAKNNLFDLHGLLGKNWAIYKLGEAKAKQGWLIGG